MLNPGKYVANVADAVMIVSSKGSTGITLTFRVLTEAGESSVRGSWYFTPKSTESTVKTFKACFPWWTWWDGKAKTLTSSQRDEILRDNLCGYNVDITVDNESYTDTKTGAVKTALKVKYMNPYGLAGVSAELNDDQLEGLDTVSMLAKELGAGSMPQPQKSTSQPVTPSPQMPATVQAKPTPDCPFTTTDDETI